MSEPVITSRPFHPRMACERCVFGTGLHAQSCNLRIARVHDPSRISNDFIDQNQWMDLQIARIVKGWNPS